MGTGLRLPEPTMLTANSLEHALNTCLTSTSMKAKAMEIGKAIRAEEGVHTAAIRIESAIRNISVRD